MNKIKKAREEKGISITKLAAVAGVSEQTMYRWERDKDKDYSEISYKSLIAMSELLDKPISFFVAE